MHPNGTAGERFGRAIAPIIMLLLFYYGCGAIGKMMDKSDQKKRDAEMQRIHQQNEDHLRKHASGTGSGSSSSDDLCGPNNATNCNSNPNFDVPQTPSKP